jgi:hypothetical protein
MDVAEIEAQRKGVPYTFRVQARPGAVEDWEGCVLDGIVHVAFPDAAEHPDEYVKFQLAAAAPASMLLEPLRLVEMVRED